MKCDICEASFTDGVFCHGCRRNMDFTCTSISESGYRKLGSERRSLWRCPQCKLSSSPRPKSPAAEPVTLDLILMELREVKSQLSKLPDLFEDIKLIKNDISDLKVSCDFNSSRIENLETKVLSMEKQALESQKMESSISRDLALLKKDNTNREQWSRMNNVEIKGVPTKHNENLFSIVDSLTKVVGYSIPKTQINYISRVPSHDSRQKSIIVSFINRYIKEEFIAAARARKQISLKDVGLGEEDRRIYINDHLVPDIKKLLTRVKEFSKQKGFQYVWVKFCKIHIRKNDRTPVHIISNDMDLSKLA